MKKKEKRKKGGMETGGKVEISNVSSFSPVSIPPFSLQIKV